MPLVEFRQAIIAAWEAATPPDYHPGAYHYVEKLSEGTSAHRTFMFRDPEGSGIKEQGSTRHTIDFEFDAVVALHLPERSSDLFDRPYREYQVLSPLVSRLRDARRTAPRVIGMRVENDPLGAEGDVELVLRIAVRTKEG